MTDWPRAVRNWRAKAEELRRTARFGTETITNGEGLSGVSRSPEAIAAERLAAAYEDIADIAEGRKP